MLSCNIHNISHENIANWGLLITKKIVYGYHKFKYALKHILRVSIAYEVLYQRSCTIYPIHKNIIQETVSNVFVKCYSRRLSSVASKWIIKRQNAKEKYELNSSALSDGTKCCCFNAPYFLQNRELFLLSKVSNSPKNKCFHFRQKPSLLSIL